MNKAIKFLALLLVVQLAVVFVINLASITGGNDDGAPKYLISDINSVTEITLKDKESSVTMKKTDDGWILADYGDQPTADGTVEGMLKKLGETKITWPVATSDSAAKRFEVAGDNAQKTLILTGGNKQVKVYVGTSPSYKKTHVRVDGSEDIYVAEVTQHELSAKAETWLNKQILQFPGEIATVKTDAFTVTRTGEGDASSWMINPNDDSKQLDMDATKAWVERFNNIIVSRLVNDSDLEQKIVVQNPAVTVNVTGKEKTMSYAFYQDGEKYYVKQFGDNPVFELPEYEAKPVVSASMDTFYVKEDTDEAETTLDNGDQVDIE